jgi:hypothetical protein
MKIRHEELLGLGNFLMELKLNGKESRMRTRLVKRMQTHLDLVQTEKDEIIQNYGVLDENGNLKTKQENGKEYYEIEDREACEKEILELLQEEMVIEENEENKEMLLVVKEAVLNCDMVFQGQQAFEYDGYCELFENLTYDKELAK